MQTHACDGISQRLTHISCSSLQPSSLNSYQGRSGQLKINTYVSLDWDMYHVLPQKTRLVCYPILEFPQTNSTHKRAKTDGNVVFKYGKIHRFAKASHSNIATRLKFSERNCHHLLIYYLVGCSRSSTFHKSAEVYLGQSNIWETAGRWM